MDFNADVTACARLVEKGDPLRFACAMCAPLAVRARLFVLYAFNVEVSRAPWVTAEPMIAEMRLQWWRDALEEIRAGQGIRRHEVVTPLAQAVTAQEAVLLDELVAARRWDVYRDGFEDQAHLERYLDQTAGNLMVVAARDEALRGTGFGGGVAAFFHAIPALEAAGRVPLVDGTPDGVRALAQKGLSRLGKGGAAALPASGARAVLKAALRDPGRVIAGTLPPLDAPFARVRARLLGRV